MKTLPNMLRSCDDTAAPKQWHAWCQCCSTDFSFVLGFFCFFLKTTSLWNNVSSGIVYFLKVQNQINTKTDVLKQLTDVEDKTSGPEWNYQEREVPAIWINTFVITSPHTRESWVTRVLHCLWRTIVWVFSTICDSRCGLTAEAWSAASSLLTKQELWVKNMTIGRN